MKDYVTVTGENIDKYIKDYTIIIFSLRRSRIKAKRLAIMEAYFALRPVNGVFIRNGPLSNIKGLFSFFILNKNIVQLKSILKGLGYCDKFYSLNFNHEFSKNTCKSKNNKDYTWKKRHFSVVTFYSQNKSIYKQHSSNNRKFKILSYKDKIKTVYGYRGNGKEYSRRALPVEDARCLVNLAIPYNTSKLLDPFAGAGGIVYEAKFIKNTLEISSVDIDPIVAPGLKYFGSTHFTSDSCEIDFCNNIFDAIVTEVPFSSNATPSVANALKNLINSLNVNGRLVVMCSIEQSIEIEKSLLELGLYNYIYQRINRKGTEVIIMAWAKSKKMLKRFNELLKVTKTIL